MLSNPVFLRMAFVWLAAVFAFVIGVVIIRRLRKSLLGEMFDEGGAKSNFVPTSSKKKSSEV